MLNGGSNDLAVNFGDDKGILSCLLKFAQQDTNTNVLLLNIPLRYDLLTNSRINHDIKNFNDKLQKRTQLLNHVHLYEVSTYRKYFTNHGFHQNKVGKEMMALQVACQIREIVNSRPNKEPVYPLYWKEEQISMNTKTDIAPSFNSVTNEGKASERVTKLPPEHCTQQALSKLGCKLRTSNKINTAEWSAVVEFAADNNVHGKVEDQKRNESETVREFESRIMNAKETSGEFVNLEENKQDTRLLCVVNSETKKVVEDKCFRGRKNMNDAKCVSVLVYDESVIEEVDKDLSETMEKKPQGSTTIKSYNDSSVTSVWEFPRSSSRNKIPASRSSDFLW